MSRGVAAAGPAGAGGALSVSNRTLYRMYVPRTRTDGDAPAPTEPRDALAVKTLNSRRAGPGEDDRSYACGTKKIEYHILYRYSYQAQRTPERRARLTGASRRGSGE